MASATGPVLLPSEEALIKAIAFVNACKEEPVTVAKAIIDEDITISCKTELSEIKRKEEELWRFRKWMREEQPVEPLAEDGKELFKSSLIAKHDEQSQEEVKAMNRRWRKMSPEEQNNWDAKADAMMEEYYMDLGEWFGLVGDKEGWIQEAYYKFFCFEDQYVAAPIPMEENPPALAFVQVERADPSAEESATEEATEGATEEATEDSTSTKR